MFGTLAGFADPNKDGFDPAPKSIANIFYLGHRRSPDVPVREVRWRVGLAVDGQALLVAAVEASHTSGAATGTNSTTSSVRISMNTASNLKGSHHVIKYLPPDKAITLTSKGNGGVVPFEDITTGSHCLCPEHGGSGTGSAWVTVSDFGPAVHCCQCNGGTTWFPGSGQSFEPFTDEDIDALVENIHKETEGKKGKSEKKPLTPMQAEQLRAEEAERAEYHAKYPEAVQRARQRAKAREAQRAKEQQEQQRRSDAPSALRVADRYTDMVRSHLLRLGMLPSKRCGFVQLIEGPSGLAAVRRTCRKVTCLDCQTRRVCLIIGSLLALTMLGKDGSRGVPMARGPVYVGRLRSSHRAYQKARERAAHKNVANFRTTPTPSIAETCDISGYMAAEVAEGQLVSSGTWVVATDDIGMREPVLVPPEAAEQVLVGMVLMATTVALKPRKAKEGMEDFGNMLEPNVVMSIRTSHSITTDPETILRRAGRGDWRALTRPGDKVRMDVFADAVASVTGEEPTQKRRGKIAFSPRGTTPEQRAKIVERTLSDMQNTAPVLMPDIDSDEFDRVFGDGAATSNHLKEQEVNVMPTGDDITRLLNTMNAHLPESTKNTAFMVVMGLSAGHTVRGEDITATQNALLHTLPHEDEAHVVLYRLWRQNYVREAA